jgi:hypothetical protein
VFDQPGIGVEDLALIHRDQFVHYVQLARALGDPGDWPQLRHDLMGALGAAFGLGAGTADGLTPPQHRALHVLDEVRREHDPVIDWPCFCEALWRRRHDIRADLPLSEARCHNWRSSGATPS